MAGTEHKTLCASCQHEWDTEPLGVCKRIKRGEKSLWTYGDAYDKNYALCSRCHFGIKQRHTKVQEGAVSFDFRNPNAESTAPEEHRHAMSLAQYVFNSKLARSNLAQIRQEHEDELFMRLRWCLDHDLLPAHDHVHLAPGDDARFMVRS